MNKRPQVLTVGRDEILSRSRKMTLGTFFDAQCAARISEARALIVATRFDLIVLCHTLRFDESQSLASLAHIQNPGTLVLAMRQSSSEDANPWADRTLDGKAGPVDLVRKCAEMLAFPLKSNGRTVHI
jgi:hypothetical protein